MNEYRPTFFVVKNRALGDSIMGLSSISYLRSLYPKSTIIYAVPQWTAKLYENVKTDADLIYPLNLSSLDSILNLYTDLINLKVDAIHEMHQSGKGHKVFSLFSIIKNIPYTFHNHHLESKTKVLDQGQKKELIQRDLDGIYSFYGKNKSIPSFLNFEPKMHLSEKAALKKRVIFGVVATRQTKMWPIDSFLSLAQKLLEYDSDYEIVIPLSNSSDDKKIKDEIELKNKKSEIKIIQSPLNLLPSLFSESDIYIGNDTGLKHLAIATGMKSITMFGPEPIREWHPYSTKKHKALYLENLSCRTRTHHYCGLSICDLDKSTNMQCMKMISVEMVFNQFKNL